MGNNTQTKVLSRRDALKLAGTAAAFCASFGFLHREGEAGPQKPTQFLKIEEQSKLQQHALKWNQAQIKWFAGNTLLATSAIPTVVIKHLQSDMNASVLLKIDGKFQGGSQFHKAYIKIDATWD